uniref:Ig-like domain-containing protein n=1 Tax=Denticeps clupeoides TaxID=299321 RepID=A0AAY4ACW2_9TELE
KQQKCNVLLFIYCSGNTIKPVRTDVNTDEGSTVTLNCTYSSAVTLYWYRQYPRSTPQYLVQALHSTGKSKTSDLDSRMTIRVKKEKNEVYLDITPAAVSDSALYYCAMQPTATGNTGTMYKNLHSKTQQARYIQYIWHLVQRVEMTNNLQSVQ